MVTVKLPTHTYLKKFLSQETDTYSGELKVSTTNSWGVALLKILGKKEPFKSDFQKQYTDSLTFSISENLYSRTGFHVSNQNVIFFNTFLRDQFHNAMFNHVTLNIRNNPKLKIENELKAYLAIYNITENDRSLETILKSYIRWRNKRNILIFRW
jgi:hypothetical protein